MGYKRIELLEDRPENWMLRDINERFK